MEYTMIKQTFTGLSLLGLAVASLTAHAVPPIPEESGWGGHINIGVGVGSSETNMLAGLSSIDLGKDRISSLDEDPGSEDITLPVLQFEAAYTLADGGTQFYLGNQVANEASFDLETTMETHAGVRQQFEGVGRVDFSLAASSIPTDVWRDPYLVDAKRGNTERTSSGVHIAWDEIFGSAFEFGLSSREVEIDDEESGVALGLSGADQRLLRREGQIRSLDLQYDWVINDRHRLVPAIGYTDYDLDGDAMAQDGPGVQLSHLYTNGRWRFASRVIYQELESDKLNPIYNKEQEVDTLGGSVTVFYNNPFGLEGWTANVTGGYQERDSNIDFYDSSFGLVSFGMFHRFK
jgi:hypothetical protein